MLQRVDLCDRIELVERQGRHLSVEGFAGDTLVRSALELLAAEAGAEPCWSARITKRIPVAAGLGGGSSDAATALLLANSTLAEPLPDERIHALAATLGADVPFFLGSGPRLATGVGTDLAPLELPQDYWVLLLLPHGETKTSTADVYARFDARDGATGYDARRRRLLDALAAIRRPRDLAQLPPNDLVSSPLADELRALGAFRADVSGAGPTVYGLFHHRAAARDARARIGARGRTWIVVPAWYG